MTEVRELAELARQKRGVKTVIGVQARGAPVLAYAKELVAQGYVGRVLSATMVFAAGGVGELIYQANAYLADKKNGATTLTVAGGHTLDALCSFSASFARCRPS